MVKRSSDVDYDNLSKVCEGCGATFYLRDRKHQSYKRFMSRGFCSSACRHNLFWPRVDVRGPEECWPWKGSRTRGGYGHASREGKSVRAHRVAYQLAKGLIPAGLVVRHKCDNPPCCNPAHLELGTHKQNKDDSIQRGRSRALDRTNPLVFFGSQAQAARAVGFSKSAIKRARATRGRERDA